MHADLSKPLHKIALFPCLGLGDGLIALILAHQFHEVGHAVTTYHPLLPQMAPLFPHLTLKPRLETLDCLEGVDRIFLFYEKLEWMQKVMQKALEQYPDKTTILNPIATPKCDYPYWEVGRFDGNQPFVDNLVRYLKEVEGIKAPTKSNGITLPDHIVPGRFANRVVLHPTSSRAGKNWTKAKFLKLATALEKGGYEPVFILTKEEAKQWPEISPPSFASLVEVAYYVAESGYMIGNDSGIGHLASCLGLPTLTICRSAMTANFWRPAWATGRVIVPPKWIPNLKGMRWRDSKWQKFVPVSKVNREFLELCELGVLSN